ncbi:MAG: 8-amino-7-oxononanoate synthase [Deltaproteobacteria bacterium]|jgi:glycine C-acetyltransferase/8-amino-7-oxononanoate synthase|nr:8-amino-7-oxononanoate synthase [Deltaproteobacteria bacterium]
MDRIKKFLSERKKSGTLRSLSPLTRLGHGWVRLLDIEGDLLDFSSNDYLALSEHPEVIAASAKYLEMFGTGAGAARLMSGDLEINHLLEQEIAQLKSKEAALTFGSGYLANTGIIPALAGRGDLIVTDRLNHASIYDGCLLSGAGIIRFRHNDITHLEQILHEKRSQFNRALVVVESIYSMDGDRCPLTELVSLKQNYDFLLMVDEAHATGLYGENGAGIIEEENVSDGVDIAMGTFGKALGSYGAYAAASQEIVDFLVNKARTFIYSTALPPAVVGATLAALYLVKSEPRLRQELHQKVAFFKKQLRKNGIKGDLGPTQIIPVMVGDSAKALAAAEHLQNNKMYVKAIRPPTVPEGSARLRLSVTRYHSEEDLKKCARSLADALRTFSD